MQFQQAQRAQMRDLFFMSFSHFSQLQVHTSSRPSPEQTLKGTHSLGGVLRSVILTSIEVDFNDDFCCFIFAPISSTSMQTKLSECVSTSVSFEAYPPSAAGHTAILNYIGVCPPKYSKHRHQRSHTLQMHFR